MGNVLNDAISERSSGGKPGVPKALIAAAAAGFTVATVTYRLLRA